MAFKEKEIAYKYINEYAKQKYDRITILVGNGKKEELQKIALGHGYKSTNDFIKDCINDKLKRYKINIDL